MFGIGSIKDKIKKLQDAYVLMEEKNYVLRERIESLEIEAIETASMKPLPKPTMLYSDAVEITIIGRMLGEVRKHKEIPMEDVINLLLENAGLEITETPSTESKIILKPKETPKAAKPKK